MYLQDLKQVASTCNTLQYRQHVCTYVQDLIIEVRNYDGLIVKSVWSQKTLHLNISYCSILPLWVVVVEVVMLYSLLQYIFCNAKNHFNKCPPPNTILAWYLHNLIKLYTCRITFCSVSDAFITDFLSTISFANH